METHCLLKLKFDQDGLPYLRIRITSSDFFRWRGVRGGDGKTVEELQAEAERYLREGYAGRLQIKLLLPLGDCGHASLNL